jgi:predicted TPR repeat methyltransferase
MACGKASPYHPHSVGRLKPWMNRKQRRAGEKVRQPSPPAGRGDATDPIALHAAGVQAFRAGHLKPAADLIAQAIAANAQMPEFHYNLAIVLRAQGKLPEAATSYERAIRLRPDYTDAHNNLGNVWKMLGERDKARACFAQALHHKPGNADTHYNLGVLCSDESDRDQAALHFRRCLELDPGDSRGAGMLLAHLGFAQVPDRTPEAQLLNLYEVRSRFWDRESTYFAHALVAEGLQQHAAQDSLDILDIGCGTGLAGALVRPLAGKLVGVDLSPAMLEKARAKEIYDRLDQADLVSFMSENQGSYDAVLGAAALIHFGNLQGVFQAAALCLRDKGLFVFTLFSNETSEVDFAVAASDKLAQSGCYTHSAGYVERLAPECGFSVQILKKAVHEHDQNGDPVAGLVVVLRRGR